MDDALANFDGELGIPYSSLLDDMVRMSYGVHFMLVFPIVFFSLAPVLLQKVICFVPFLALFEEHLAVVLHNNKK